MSWLYSRALVEEYLGATSSGGVPSAPSKSTPTPQAYCAPDKMTDFSRLSRFGMTFSLLMVELGEGLLTWYLAASHAWTSAQPDLVQESTENDLAFGAKCAESLARYDRLSHSWKTAQCSLFGGLIEFSGTWPRWGMMRNGEFWALTTPVTTTQESGSGLLPTCLANDGKGGTTRRRKEGQPDRISEWRHYVCQKYGMRYPHPMHSECRMGWPLGWTDLKPLEMGKFQQWQQQHSAFYLDFETPGKQ